MGPEKNTFYSGAIGPHLGEIWNFEIFNITVFEPILAKSLQKTRKDVNLQICGVVPLQGCYKTAQKNWGNRLPTRCRGPRKKWWRRYVGITASWCRRHVDRCGRRAVSAYRPGVQ